MQKKGKMKLFFLFIITIFFSLSIATAQVSDRANDIHITPLEELMVDNNDGTIRLYFKLEKAKLVNPNWKTKEKVVKRESPTTGKKGYFAITPLTDLKTENFSI